MQVVQVRGIPGA